MKKALAILAGFSLPLLGTAAFIMLSPHSQQAAEVPDPRQDSPLVQLVRPRPVSGIERSFTGVIAARVQSGLGFRVPGKIIQRHVSAGQQVKAGQPLMQLDDADLRLVLTARHNAVLAALAIVEQLSADERRYAKLVKDGWSTRQRYDQAKALLATAKAQLAAAEAYERVAENEIAYALLVADSDGTVVDTSAEPGQVVAAGQVVIRLAQSGPREAVVALPETMKPALGSTGEAEVFGVSATYKIHLRQRSDAADERTRTFEARFVLDGEAAPSAPLGATVTVRLRDPAKRPELEVPLGSLKHDGKTTGVWVYDAVTTKIRLHPVRLVRLSDESAIVDGLNATDSVVALGAHLLQDGAVVKVAAAGESN